jgi:hypothetical protein
MTPPRFTDDEIVDIINGTRLRSPVHRNTGLEHISSGFTTFS